MRDSAAVRSPPSDTLAATAPHNRGARPPVCPPPGNPPQAVRFITALRARVRTNPRTVHAPSPPHARGCSPQHLVNLLVTRHRLY